MVHSPLLFKREDRLPQFLWYLYGNGEEGLLSLCQPLLYAVLTYPKFHVSSCYTSYQYVARRSYV